MGELYSGFEIEKELTRIYNRFNHHFWNDELPEVIITFQPKKGTHGHISAEPIWISESSRNDNKYELNISAYTINRSPEKICETVLHEQCHLYCNIHNIQDCSNMGRYHNKKFKEVAESHGLNVEKRDYYGYCITTLDEEARKYVSKLNIKKITYKYAAKRNKEMLMRYKCPGCTKTTAWVSSDQSLICGLCKTTMVYWPASSR